MAVHFTILGSGSGGNCALLECGDTRILIDAGFSGKQIRQRMAAINRSPETLSGILITHEHSDHIQGLLGIAAKTGIKLYCNRLTKEAIEAQFKTTFQCQIFITGNSFEIGEMEVDTFSVPHDAYDPVGFLIKTDCGNIGFLTDLGHATKMVVERIRRSHILVLETNHDHKMLQDDVKRPWSVKQRILSRHGHLSNEAAADVLEQVVSPALRKVFLGHLSRDCNKPELARKAIVSRLEKMQAEHIEVEVTSQDHSSPTLTLHELLPIPVMQTSPEFLATTSFPSATPLLPGFL
ncbi:MAG: Metal-dependent hydrolase [Verrucomicrobiales bacterium]|nr:Metal-dependent hydrolase [Verrucomicrobiales bacterium]